MDFNPTQLVTLLGVFVGIHVLALPALAWAFRSRQFSGAEQKLWSLDDVAETPAAPAAVLPASPGRARLMLTVLATMAVAMLGSVLLVLFTALHAGAAAHPTTGTCPFKF